MAGDSTNSQARVLLGRIGPAVVLICLLLDVSLRFLPPRLITFRAWEAVSLFATGKGPFARNTVYRNMRSSGDLASLANLPHLRQYHEEVFTTDAAGYRNRGETAKPFTGILLVGDSFAAGSGVSDSQTVSEQLNDISGRRVYNGAATPSLWELVQYLQMTRGLVVWQQSERSPLPLSIGPEPVSEHGWKGKLVRRAFGDKRTETLLEIYRHVLVLESYSPLEILLGRAVKRLQNDKVFPNPYRSEAVAAKLRNGREILFLPTEVTNYEIDRPTDPEVFVQLKIQLQKKGIELLVLLVPDKYVVYHDLLLPALPRTERRQFLDIVEQRLAAANVPVLNLTPDFRKQAEELLARGEYLYWLDDTHWNAEGIREAAREIAKSKAVFECPCR
jgi:hypothetical protein